jgi:NitT/TauT family transport system ATP-binding protein
MYIEVKNVSREYIQNGTTFKALDKVNLTIARGEFICLLGPSGCGKTTLLNSLAGFEQVTEGSIKIDGVEVKEPSVKNVTLFQNYGLLPWRTVQKNVELGLENKRLLKQEIQAIADKYIDIVGLTAFKKSHPCQLSGGMQQRVAIARALAVDPDILFMDEPFGALDALTRMKMQDEISAICKNKQKTIIFVTHDIDESVFLADRIIIMTPNPGRIKTIVKVDLRGTRDRTSTNFLKVRDRVFAEFEMKVKDKIEYFI